MTSITEIEKAIEHLPFAQVEELARWLDVYRSQRSVSANVDAWLPKARGVALTGVTTEKVMALTRGEE